MCESFYLLEVIKSFVGDVKRSRLWDYFYAYICQPITQIKIINLNFSWKSFVMVCHCSSVDGGYKRLFNREIIIQKSIYCEL